ncbi:replication protein A, subunit RPA32 [Mollisia scopiformis]|uniref:Replication protein A, subunit RPA32 n=1 Tax=Mollisia scopiformis TaxID=149040 RepID=A0A194X7W4_MOLSC|nr:replication protein A, subunit RPA32 [Mollisia scopiformis]KUJ16194.1 replication protein A, subunit RPA32 [Mollisia scopiformis]
MANYGYNGGNYSTASYGAQGGADGGGFMGGSQQGSQEGGGSKTYGKDTVRPVTIKQILEAQQPHPDSDFKIDGSEVTQLSFVGQINMISCQATNNTFQIDDGTGVIDVKQWIDSDQLPEHARPLPKEGEYVHVWGRLKAFNNKRHVGSHVIRPVSDFNEVSCHLLEATAVHLYFVRGPPPGPHDGAMKDGGGAQGMFVDSYGGAAPQTNGGGKQLPAKLSATARKVFQLLQSSPQNNEGLHVSMIAQKLSLQGNDVFKAGDELLADGLIYTTVDDETWAVLEY